MDWDNYFNYEDGVLYWKVRRMGVKFGSAAGCHEKMYGYILVGFNGRTYKAHRIIWEMFNGPIPAGMQIDHINHVRHDNRIENLRIVTNQGNAMNGGFRSDNTSGTVGVSWIKSRNRWFAHIRVDGKTIPLGRFVDINKAIEARRIAEIKYGFHRNHGTQK